MTTRAWFRLLRADFFREDVHAFVCVDKIADSIVRSNNPQWSKFYTSDGTYVGLLLLDRESWEFVDFTPGRRTRKAVVAYKQLLALCTETAIALKKVDERFLSAPEAESLRTR